MRSIVETIETGLRCVAALCLFGLFVLVTLQVALRYGIGRVPLFTEEFARYAMIWMALMAVAVGVREGSHIRIDFLAEMLRAFAPRALRGLEFLLDMVSIAIFLILVWYGIDMAIFAAGQTSGGLQIPLSYPYAAVPIAFGFATLFALARLVAGRSAV